MASEVSHSLRLQACQPLDVTDCYAVPTGTLNQSNFATCVCMHPTKPLLAVAAGNSLAVYDLVSCTRLTRNDMKSACVEMAFSPDGIMLVMVLQDWMIAGLSMATWRVHLLVPRKQQVDKPLETCLLAVSGGARASLFYCRYGKVSVRQALLSSTEMTDAKGRPVRVKEGWGTKLKLEPAKPILGLAMAPGDAVLLVLHGDGGLRGYTPQVTTETVQPLYSVAVQEPIAKAIPAPGTLVVVPDPCVQGSALIIQAAHVGGLTVMQQLAGNLPPTVIFKGRVPGLPIIVGAGVLQAARALLVIGQSESGRLRAAAFNLAERAKNTDTPTMQPVRVDPGELAALLDPRVVSQTALTPPTPAQPPASQQTWSPHQASYATRMTDGMGGLAAPSGTKGAPAEPAAPVGVTNALVRSLWSGTPAWAHTAANSSALLGQLQPQAARAVMHPVLPVVALQLQPSRIVMSNQSMSRLPLAGASPEEYLLARKTLSVPLLTGVSWESLVAAGSARAQVCPLHSTLQHWVPMAGTGVKPAAAPAPASGASTPTSGLSSARPSLSGPAPAGSVTGDAAKPALSPTAGPHFSLPGSVFFVSGTNLCRYSLASKAVTTVMTLPDKVPNGPPMRVHSIVQSKAGAWLVFFEVVGAQVGADKWLWTLVLAGQLETVWLKSGKTGAFLGPDEEHLAVSDYTGRLAAVFKVSETTHPGAAPLYVYSLEGLASPSGALPVFSGPPRDPVQDPGFTAVLGCVMWQSAAGGLACRPLPDVLDGPAESGPLNYSAPAARPAPGMAPRPSGPRPGGGPIPLALPTTYTYYSDGSSSGSDAEDGGPVRPRKDKEGDDDGPEEPQGTGAVPRDSELGPLGSKYWLPLLPGELVLQVAWQPLSWSLKPAGASDKKEGDKEGADADGEDDAGSESDSDDSVTDSVRPPSTINQPGSAFAAMAAAVAAQEKDKAGGKKGADKRKKSSTPVGPCMGAVLTNQRVILVTEVLNVHAVVPLSSLIRSALPAPGTNLLWVGPALLLMLADGRVVQVTWAGAVHPVATLAPSHTTHIVGATPDALLLLRAGGDPSRPSVHPTWKVVARPINLLQPLVLGWSSLALLPNVAPGPDRDVVGAARKILSTLVEGYDPSSTTPALIWALLGTCALDLAYVLATRLSGAPAAGTAPALALPGAAPGSVKPPAAALRVGSEEHAAYLAAAAAAGEWAAVEKALGSELEHAAYYPAPPPSGSAAHWKLLAAGAGAVAHGQFARAVSLLQMAGEWRLAMVVAGAAGDANALYRVATSVADVPGAAVEAEAAQRLAGALRQVHGGGGHGAVDAKLQLVVGEEAAQGAAALGKEGPAVLAGAQWPLGSPRSVLPAVVEVTEVEGLRAEAGEVVPRVPLEHPLVAALGLDPSTRKAMSLPTSMPSSYRSAAPATSGTSVTGDDKAAALRAELSAASVDSRPSASAASMSNMPSLGPAPLPRPGAGALDDIFGFDAPTPTSKSGRPTGSKTGDDSDSGFGSDSEPEPTQAWKGKVQIREKGAAPTFAANADELRDAVRSLRLAPPPTGSGGLSALGPIPAVGQGLAPTTSGLSPALQGGGPSLNLGAPPAPAAPIEPLIPDVFDFPPAAKPAAGVAGTAPAAPAAPLMPSDSLIAVSPKKASGPAPGAFQGLSPALAATMQPQAAAAPAPAAAFAGISPALAAGMRPQPAAPAPALTTQGLSPALAAGMRAPAPAPAPATAPAPAGTFAGLSPALAATMQPAARAPPAVPPRAGLPASALTGLSPALAAGMVVAGTQPAAAPAPVAAAPAMPAPLPLPPVTAAQADPLFHEGVAFLEAGDWQGAEVKFACTLAALKLQPPSDMQRSKQSFTSQYLAAVQLLAVATTGNGPKEARLYRYAAALPLDTRHRLALAREAVARNKLLGNYKYCGDVLTWMVTNLVGVVPDNVLQQLQVDIQECDRAGGRNAAGPGGVPRDEEVDVWATLAASCTSREEVRELVGPLVAAA